MSSINITRKIGSTFDYKGATYKVIKSHLSGLAACEKCAFDTNQYCLLDKKVIGFCSSVCRTDKQSVYFKKIKDMKYNNTKDEVIINPPYKYGSNGDYKDIIINIPEECEIDMENSNLLKGVVKFKRKHLTLDDIYKNQGSDTFCINVVSNSRNKYSKIAAIAHLMDIAKYYNGDWKVNYGKDTDEKYYIAKNSGGYFIAAAKCNNLATIAFKNSDDAQSVIDNPNFRCILDAIYKD